MAMDLWVMVIVNDQEEIGKSTQNNEKHEHEGLDVGYYLLDQVDEVGAFVE